MYHTVKDSGLSLNININVDCYCIHILCKTYLILLVKETEQVRPHGMTSSPPSRSFSLVPGRRRHRAEQTRHIKPLRHTHAHTHTLHGRELEDGTVVSRERRAATAALDGAGGGWMRPRLALSPVKSHGRTRERTETGGDSSRGE